ncbi:MAG: glutamine synthetase family protein [Berryella intestinalis]|uniref:glutamine synthetase family protein n=1 Tax=Berryella intestinalis TaxID=1531429 RepID=UPI002A501C92|nr:glutamine synthetase family protein [Berryella intestinalis]MDD7369932.1 glutamine synthetase family protein [Berryella intestinalis]MDY3129584.1 glutamine synthetase family protein [Berryella intestinalis]
MSMTPQQDFVMKTIESRDIHFVRFWFTDVLGNMKSFAVSPSELEGAFSDGMGFDGSCIAGFGVAQESDMLAYPDASTFQILPWRPSSNAVARMFCSVKRPDGREFEGDPRLVLQRMVQKAADAGFTFNVGPELEYYYFESSEGTKVLDRGGYFDLTTLDSGTDLRRDTVLTLEGMGIPVEYSHHENGPSQNEIDLRYTDALSMADAVMTYKQVVKEIARKYGVYASFMPKPLEDEPGSGMHVHQSLFSSDGKNAFFDQGDPLGYNLSMTAKRYIAGLLKYAPEFSLLTNQYVNSYKRLTTGAEVPAYLSWGHKNRSTLIRIPGYRPNRAEACRVELRSPDSAANPYLAFSAMLSAGLAGIEQELDIPDPIEETNLFEHSRWCLEGKGLQPLPLNLGEAIERFKSSELMRSVLGDYLHSYLVRAKTEEWEEYQKHVSRWELDKLLPIL